MEKNMENTMVPGGIGLYRDPGIQVIPTLGLKVHSGREMEAGLRTLSPKP